MRITAACEIESSQYSLYLAGHFYPPSQLKAKLFHLEEKKPQFGLKNVFNPEQFNSRVEQLRKTSLRSKISSR